MLKILRTSKSITQSEMARRLNVNQYNISDYETGRAEPNIDTLIKLADIYEVTLDDMLGRKNTFAPKKETSSFDVFGEYIKDLHSIKILRRIEKLTDKEKDMLYTTIDSIIKSMFNK